MKTLAIILIASVVALIGVVVTPLIKVMDVLNAVIHMLER